MLTILHKSDASLTAVQTVFSADEARHYAGADPIPGVAQPINPSVEFSRGGHVERVIDYGLIYVMNDTGKTVAKFDLRPLGSN